MRTIIAALCLTSTVALAGFPKNDLYKQDGKFEKTNMTEREFGQLIDEVAKTFGPIVSELGGRLVFNKRWNDATVNAMADRNDGNWNVTMFGGLARRPEVTPDGFTLVICHELGHHMGTKPYYGPGDWASSEGQSDYFAAQACARLLWRNQPLKNSESRSFISPFGKSRCDKSWKLQQNRDICYRTTLAGQSLANLLASINGMRYPKLETPDTRVVDRTIVSHPPAQCRLDTYSAGSICTKPFPFDYIPEPWEDTACKVLGVRPKCWFASED